ncbi:MAG: hypothetical protein RBT69_11895, partial [Spirochaetia bacterium]|nr:hypothetical protein [Spirochaetia bacterium]
IIPVLEELAITYQVDINNLPIVGGWGGCSSVVPLVAKIKNMKYLIGKNAHVISPIGVALSMVRESVERHIVDPSEEDLDDLRNIVVEKLVSTGVKRESISVEITTDPLKGIYKAVATGVNNNVMHQRDRKSISAGEINDIVREHANITPAVNIESDRCNDMIVASFRKKDTSFLKKIFFPSTRRIYVLSHTGQILYNTIHGEYRESAMGTITNDMKLLLDKYSEYGDMGERIPEVFIVISNKIVDYSMIRKRTELITMCNTISKGYDKDEKCIIILQL